MVTKDSAESKSILHVTITLNEQTLSKILEALAQLLPPSPSAEPAQANPGVASPQLEALQKANASLWNRLQAMQKEISSLHAHLAKPQPSQPAQAKPSSQAEDGPGSQAAQPVLTPGAGTAVQTVQPEVKHGEAPGKAKPVGQAKAGQVQPPEAEKAERWAREHLAEWVDTPCRFAKAQGRTWRQLAENQGEKIEIKGKPCSPRAYLHSLEGWDACKVWQRMKAKVALEVGKNGNDIDNHLAAIGS